MASVRFTDVQARPTEFLDLTSLTLAEFQQLVPPFEAAYHAPMQADSSMITPLTYSGKALSPLRVLEGNVEPPKPGVAGGSKRRPVVKGEWKPHLQGARVALRRHQET